MVGGDPTVSDAGRKKRSKRPPCICGACNRRQRGRLPRMRETEDDRRGVVHTHVHPPQSCGRYKAYTDGYCRNCSHGRACCNR